MNAVLRSTGFFVLAGFAVAALVFAGARMVGNDYVFFAGYTVLQFVVLATAWNILGGLTGYVNFGAAAFFACGAYSTVFFHKYWSAPDAMKMMQQINFNKNIAIAGGLLALAAFGPGRFSIDKR